MNEKEKDQKGKLLLSLGLEGYRNVRAADRHLTDKINNMIAVDATAISVLLGAAYFLLERRLFSSTVFWLIGPAVLLLLASLMVGIIGYRPLPFQFMNPMDLIRELHQDDKTYGYAVRRSAGTISAIVEVNISIVNGKARVIKWMLGLVLGAFAWTAVSVLFIFTHFVEP